MSEFKDLKLSEIVASPTNPRTEFEENSLNELAESIKEHGVLQPVMVRKHPTDSKKYEIVCGERRFRASKIAGAKTIPVSVRELTDDEVFEIQIIENLERKDVHPLDEAKAFQKMLDSGKYTMEDISAKIAKTLTFVAQRLKLNDLIPELQKEFLKGEFGIGHANLFARIDSARQIEYFENLDSYYSPGFGSLKEVQQYLDRKNANLDEAIFPLGDSTLNPDAGSCFGCLKCASANPVLFPEVEDNYCFDTSCFDKKDITFRLSKIHEIISENPNTIFTVSYGFDNKQILKVLEDFQITPLKEYDDYNNYGDQKNKAEVFNLKKFKREEVFLKKASKSNLSISGTDESSNIAEEISKIKSRANRALELDREKIYKRSLDEIKKVPEKNITLLSTSPLLEIEKKALALCLLSYEDDKWIQEMFDEKIGYNDRHNQLEKIFSEEFLNKLIRHKIQRELISENIMDYEKSDRPFYMHQIFKHYFPEEIQLYTDEQNDVAAKRIEKSNKKVSDLEKLIKSYKSETPNLSKDLKLPAQETIPDENDQDEVDHEERCAKCFRSNEDFIEEFGYPAMFQDGICSPCRLKSDNE